MNYNTIDEYLSEADYSVSCNELWICDTELIKNQNKFPSSFGLNIITFEKLLELLFESLEFPKKQINKVEKFLIIEKIISKNTELSIFENKNQAIAGIIQILDYIRLYPGFNINEEESNLKEIINLLFGLYKVNTDGFIDNVEKIIEISSSPVRTEHCSVLTGEHTKLVMYGEFFDLSEIEWKILQNFSSFFRDIVFISRLSNQLSEFFSTKNYQSFSKKMRLFFHSGAEGSLNYKLKNLVIHNSVYSLFSDWSDELNYIAREIKKDLADNKILLNEIGLFIPSKVYAFKISEVFDDYELLYFTTFSANLTEFPLTRFICFFLEMDWNNTNHIFRFLNSPFIRINFDDFITEELPDDEMLEDIKLADVDVITDNFSLKFIYEVFLGSGVENIFFEEAVLKRIKGHFSRKINYSLDDKLKIVKEYKKARVYLNYLLKKIREYKELVPESCYAEEFIGHFMETINYFHIDANYPENDPTNFNKFNSCLNFWKELCISLNSLNNKKHRREDYSTFFKKFASNLYFNFNRENNQGILVTELSSITKLNLKRIYLVGMTSRLFPGEYKNDSFSNLINKIIPVQPRDRQFFALFELINNINDSALDLRLSMPKLINNSENEPSGILVDLNIKPKIHKSETNNELFSNTDKCQAIAKSNISVPDQFQRVTEIVKQRKTNIWTKFEGHLESIENSVPFEKHTSVSQVEEFAACPMKFFFKRKLKIEKRKASRKDLEANVKGTIIHKIFEDYYTKLVREYSLKLPIKEKQKLILEISNNIFKSFEESYDNLYIDILKDKVNSGLGDEPKKGILYRVLEIDEERIASGWLPSEFELSFEYEIDGFKFNGVIDRIDLKEDRFQIIDYKTGGIKDTDDIKAGLSFQLPVYIKAYQGKTEKIPDSSGYYALKDIEKISTKFIIPEKNKNEIITDTQSLLQKSTEHLAEIKNRLLKSQYNFTLHSPEIACKYCEYIKICRYNQDKVESILELEKPEAKKIKILAADNFVFLTGGNSGGKAGLTVEQKMALDTGKNIIVTAGAGAGKTEVLTQRMLNLIEQTSGKIEKILVITFTRKATAEMQHRIYSTLVKKIIKGDDHDSYYLTAKLNFSRNWISTIDGFYMRLLKEYSIELGLDSDFNIAEPQELNLLISETIESQIDELSSSKNKDLEKLLRIWTRDQIIEHCNTLINQHWIHEFLKLENYDDKLKSYNDIFLKEAKQIQEQLEKIIANEIYSVNSGYPTESAAIIQKCFFEVNKFIQSFPAYKRNKDFEEEKFKRRPKNFDEVVYDYPKQVVKSFITIIDFSENTKIEADYLISLIEILKVVEADYIKKRKQKNLNTFSDVSQELYNLLKQDINNFREKVNTKFDFIMIDEFQDTDRIQWEIAKYLSGWDGESLESISPNKLFIVGDDKQSIYGFRGGDVQVFNSARKEIIMINQEKKKETGFIAFPDNFRSSKNIIEFFNSFFAVILGDADKPYEAKHQNLKGHKENGSINFFLFNKGNKIKNQNKNLEAKFIAAQIKEILIKNPTEQIALLFRTKKNIPRFAKALETLDINYIITGGKGFYENEEILDIYNILVFLADESRKIELIGFLRSPLAALSDTEIYNIRGDFIEGLKKHHPDIFELIFGKYQDTKLVKKGWKQLICELNIHELVIKIVNDTNYKTALYMEMDSLQRIKNLIYE